MSNFNHLIKISEWRSEGHCSNMVNLFVQPILAHASTPRRTWVDLIHFPFLYNMSCLFYLIAWRSPFLAHISVFLCQSDVLSFEFLASVFSVFSVHLIFWVFLASDSVFLISIFSVRFFCLALCPASTHHTYIHHSSIIVRVKVPGAFVVTNHSSTNTFISARSMDTDTCLSPLIFLSYHAKASWSRISSSSKDQTKTVYAHTIQRWTRK